MKNLLKFHFDTTLHALQFLTAVLEDNKGSWGYIDSSIAYVVGDIIIGSDIPLDGILYIDSFSEVSTLLCGK